mmetsp:Transcript_6136/g.9449  ORF Transcript_6136/g.9449 Transcript_6136/m.9449 type:complete len:353 (+) Transcript_6136:164-1222(+)|eukprot:CAMPEP_0184671522 /NCGR_PEP_ID=MMETSP0308-20130426/85556_1 /TAXON_ID=38269 /ORGANISM="Gloeochaete witrockiana, Strain SAG 46.84" /LENGTH=352 /DNA_ID=CAMNT_0027118675 /DNA_START=131 /DNA_END=1189 /DNA_ORIENTATION=+
MPHPDLRSSLSPQVEEIHSAEEDHDSERSSEDIEPSSYSSSIDPSNQPYSPATASSSPRLHVVNSLLTGVTSPLDEDDEFDLHIPHHAFGDTFLCGICFCDVHIDEEFSLPSCPEHKFCMSDIRTYLSHKIRDGAVLNLKCPDLGCGNRMSSAEVERMVPPALFLKYSTFLLMQSNPNARQCPRCNEIQVFDGKRRHPEMACTKADCKFQFCFFHGEAHPGVSCKVFMKTKGNSENERRCRDWEESNAKRCKKCKAYIEKNSGCNHMTCRCGYQFCYLCRRQMTAYHYRLYNPFGCPGLQSTKMGKVARWATRAGVLVSVPIVTVAAAAVAVPAAIVAAPFILARKLRASRR